MSTFSKPKPAGTPTWVDLASPNPEASRAFYHAVFGWEYDIGGAEFGGYATARVGKLTVAGIGGQMPGSPPGPATWNLYFASNDLAADSARAEKLGATVLSPAMEIGEFGGMAVLKDPTGAAFSFWKAGMHIGAQLMEDAGSTAWFELYSPHAKQSLDFYAALLGASTETMPGGMEYYTLKHGEYQMCGIMQIDPAWGNMQPMWATYFSVVNTDQTVATIVKHGGKIMGNAEDSPFGRMAACVDPVGAMFKVIEPPKR